MSDLCEFGTPVFIRIEPQGKLNERAKAGHFVGYDAESKGYCIYWPEQSHIYIEQNVLFSENIVTPPHMSQDEPYGISNQYNKPTVDPSKVSHPTENIPIINNQEPNTQELLTDPPSNDLNVTPPKNPLDSIRTTYGELLNLHMHYRSHMVLTHLMTTKPSV